MTVVYQTIDGRLKQPENAKEQLHEYHDEISSRVDCGVVGVTGQGPAIRTISLEKECDVSELEDWLGVDLVRPTDE